MKLIVGLGNPGSRYQGTRHNLGYVVVDELARRWAIDMTRLKFHARYGDGHCGQERVVLLKPMTFMNLSGQAVWPAAKFYGSAPADLLVVLDDAALPLGQLRLRARGSAGGHNGLQNIIDRVGSDEFSRLRLGIDAPHGVSADYVLSRFSETELATVNRMIDDAAQAVECWLDHGPETTMNRFNRKQENN